MTTASRTLPNLARWLAAGAGLAGTALPDAQAASSSYAPGDRSCRPATPDQLASLRLVFADWRGTVPGEIRLCVISPGVGGNYILPPLRLDATGDHYAAAPGQMRAPSTRDDCAGH